MRLINSRIYNLVLYIKKNGLLLHLILYLIFNFFYNFNYNNKCIFNIKVKNIEYCKKINAYSLSSFSYTLLGIFMLKYKINLKHYDSFYPIFLIFQGLISYISDSMYIDKAHWSHPIDHSFATYNLLIGILIGRKYNMSKKRWFLTFCGILCQKIGSIYLNNNKVYMYCFFHFIWHTIIPLIAIYTIKHNT